MISPITFYKGQMRFPFAVACLASAVCTCAAAQEVWIGRTTIGDIIHRDAVEVIKSIQELQRASVSAKQFSTEIEQARREFFASVPDSAERARAEKRFAELLQQKDIHYLGLSYMSSVGGSAVKTLEIMSGTQIDGGIPQAAQAAFDAWASAVRKVVALEITEARVAMAIVANQHLYEEYKILRDKAEMHAMNNLRARMQGYSAIRAAIDDGLLPDGDRKLASHKVVQFDPSRHLNRNALGNKPNQRRFSELLAAATAAAPLQVLECAYGPMSATENGGSWTLVYSVYRLWYRVVPQGLEEMIASNQAALLVGGGYERNYLYTALALENCGETRTQVDTLLEEHAKTRRAALTQSSAMAFPASAQERKAIVDAANARRLAAANERACAGAERQLASVRQHAEGASSAQLAAAQRRIEALESTMAAKCGR